MTDGDGNTKWEDRLAYDDSKVVVDIGHGVQYVKVSDEIPSWASMDASIKVWGSDGTNLTISPEEYIDLGNGSFTAAGAPLFIATDNFEFMGMVFPEKGVYFITIGGGYTTGIASAESDTPEITWDGSLGRIKKLDEKYLPDTVATKSEVNAAQTTANAALAKFPLKYSDVVDTPFSAVEVPGEVTTYSRSSIKGGTFINLVINIPSDLTGSGFYKVSSDVFDFEDIYKICYKFKYSSGASGNLISVDDLEPKVNFSSDHSVFLINNDILFCGSTGTFTITINGITKSFSVTETGIYSYTCMMSSSHSFVNHIELTKKVSGFIQSGKPVLIPSSTEGSTKKFKITVDDNGTISATEVTTK